MASSVGGRENGFEGVAYPELNERVEALQRDVLAVAGQVNSLATRLGDVQRALRSFAGAGHAKRQVLESQQVALLSSVLGILDYVEALRVSGKEPTRSQLSGVSSRGEQTLQDLGIKEIPVELGEPFTGQYHKKVLGRPSPHPSGSVIEVARRGWWLEAGEAGVSPVVIRPVEVVTSEGPSLPPESVLIDRESAVPDAAAEGLAGVTESAGEVEPVEAPGLAPVGQAAGPSEPLRGLWRQILALLGVGSRGRGSSE